MAKGNDDDEKTNNRDLRGFQWFPFYVAIIERVRDACRAVGHAEWTAEAIGLRMILIADAWHAPAHRIGMLPDDDRELAAIARIDVRVFRRLKPLALCDWEPDGEGWLRCKELDADVANALAKLAQKSRAGAAPKGAKKNADLMEISKENQQSHETGRSTSRSTDRDRQGEVQLQPEKKEISNSTLNELISEVLADFPSTSVPELRHQLVRWVNQHGVDAVWRSISKAQEAHRRDPLRNCLAWIERDLGRGISAKALPLRPPVEPTKPVGPAATISALFPSIPQPSAAAIVKAVGQNLTDDEIIRHAEQACGVSVPHFELGKFLQAMAEDKANKGKLPPRVWHNGKLVWTVNGRPAPGYVPSRN